MPSQTEGKGHEEKSKGKERRKKSYDFSHLFPHSIATTKQAPSHPDISFPAKTRKNKQQITSQAAAEPEEE